ncbi:MAG: T9SS type A sorting domain-containing protein [Bacteroidales bacterium]|nr:T9SS type A sorting domain-containing protein [Bacteroidales bacterium]
MRKTLLLALALFFAVASFAQNRALILSESFDGNELPEGWSIKENGSGNWSASPTDNAGGVPNEMRLYWNPTFFGKTRLCTPNVDLTGITSVVFSFKHYLDNYQSNASTLGIATSSDNGSTWNVGWSANYNTDGQYSIDQIITTSDMGKSSVMFCIYFDGNASNIDYWYFDDVTISTMEDNDVKLSNIVVANYLSAGDVEVSFSIQNVGSNNISSFEASYEVDGTTVNETFNTSLETFANNQFTFSEKASLIPGNYDLTINIASINGGDDDDISNNVMSKEIKVAMGSTKRIPMIEHFSSSTCGPCVYINTQMHSVCSSNPGKFAYVKYPMYWPSPGDPYNTDEATARKTYYNIGGVPNVIYDGVNIGAVAVTASQLDESINSDAFVKIKGAFNLDGSTINVVADVLPYVALEGCRVFVTVNEKTTYSNTGTNGETEFHHIMMKMLENAEGNELTAEAGEYQRYEFTYDMSQTHVEELSDLEVAVWVQHYNSMEVFNSTFLNEYTEHNYPIQNLQMTENGNNLDIVWEAPETGNPTGYDIIVNGELVAENTQNTSYSFSNVESYYIVEVVAKYGETESIGVVVNNISESGNDNDDPCNAPTNLGAIIEKDVEGYEYKFKVTMTWDAVEGATGYEVYVNGSWFGMSSDNFYIAGSDNEGTFDFAVTTLCANGESEMSESYTVVVDDDALEEYTNRFEIYPNPAEDFVKISSDNNQISVIRIYNVIGVMIEEIEVNSNDIEINISNYNPGVYFFNIDGEVVKVIRN